MLKMTRRRPGAKIGLIRMRDNAGIEKCRALQRILAGKIGADEQLCVFGNGTSLGK